MVGLYHVVDVVALKAWMMFVWSEDLNVGGKNTTHPPTLDMYHYWKMS